MHFDIGIPVHINGYFELSSNRRNIWHSSLQSESSGAGKHKSDWNIALLEVTQLLLITHRLTTAVLTRSQNFCWPHLQERL